MQLTKRQCWDIVRRLVSDKNKEYARFLKEQVGEKNLSLCIGYTKSLYLGKFGFRAESDFRYLLKHRGVTPAKEWLDNLSSEDLLLFLDFRCRTLQAMYDFCAKHNGISVNDIRELIIGTKRSSLINYNAGRLKATGRPEAIDGELDVKRLDMTDKDLNEQALVQIMTKIAVNHTKLTDCTIEKALDRASRLTTSNIDTKGFMTGHKFMSKLLIPSQYEQKETSAPVDNDKPHLAGFDVNKCPVFMKGDDFITITGEKAPYVKIVYDRRMVKIEEYETKPKFVGLDIQGTPVFEHEDGYYTINGRRLDKDEYFYSQNEIETLDL